MSRQLLLVASLTLAALYPRAAAAQAWVPPKGEGSVALLYQDLFVKDHFFDRGQRRDRGEINSQSLLLDLTYGVTDRLAITFAVPYVRARYSGTAPHPTAQDDGATHHGLQDVRFSARFNVIDGPLTITPFVATSVPTHDYEYFAHAALGPHVPGVEVGAYVGRMLASALPNAFVQFRYSYGFGEKIVGIRPKRSNLDVEVGYFVTKTVRVFTLGSGRKAHGGIDVPEAGWRVLPPALGPHHDQIGRIDLLDVGAGVQASVTKSLDVFGSYMKSLAGRNTHAINRGITVGASWSFGRGLRSMMQSAAAPSSSDEEGVRHLVKCLCQK